MNEKIEGKYLLKSRHRVEQLNIQHRIILRERAIPVVVDQLDDRMEVIRIREPVFPISMADLDEFIGPAFTQCQSILAAFGRRITYQKGAVRRVNHHLVYLVSRNVTPIPFGFL